MCVCANIHDNANIRSFYKKKESQKKRKENYTFQHLHTMAGIINNIQ